MDYADDRAPRPKVTITEVGTRDGFQAEPDVHPHGGQGGGHRRADRGRRAAHRGDVVRQPARGAAARRRARRAGAPARRARGPHRGAGAECARRRARAGRRRRRARVLRVGERDAQPARTSTRRSAQSLANVAEIAAIARGSRSRCAARWRARSDVRSRARCRSTRCCGSSTATRGSASTASRSATRPAWRRRRRSTRAVVAIRERFPRTARSRCTSTTRAASGSPT